MSGKNRFLVALAFALLALVLWRVQSWRSPPDEITVLPAASPDAAIQLEERVDEILADPERQASSMESEKASGVSHSEPMSSSPESLVQEFDRDEEWDSLPRNELSITSLVLRAEHTPMQQLVPLLYRNSHLNEGDIYIEASRRPLLGNQVVPIGDQLRALGTLQREYLEREMPLLAAAGMLPKMSAEVTPEKIELMKKSASVKLQAALRQQAAGEDMSAKIAEFEEQLAHPERFAHLVVPSVPGVVGVQLGSDVYQAPLWAIPGGRTLMETKSYLRSTLALTCLAWFEREGTVSIARSRAERERIGRAFEKEEMK